LNNTFSRVPSKKPSVNKGLTFIEVLVAVFILVTGILGAVAMQASAKKGSFDAMQRSVASALAQDIVERMRSNNATALAGYAATDYGVQLDTPPDKRCNTIAGLCSPAEMMGNDRYEWEVSLMGADVVNGGNNRAGLTGVRGCISQAANAVTVVVSWEGRTDIADAKKDSCGTASTKRRQVIVKAFIN
jgi:type IV pilus assembly protein PilV|tara:strand:+ start:3825 stop:4388 length:564 start_codon:yes stop_codon:yes gene_type:complete